MGILNNIRHTREIGRLRQLARSTPSPASFCALAERCVALGRIEDARRAARQGLDRFPQSSRLVEIESFAVRNGLRSKIAILRRQVADDPTPRRFGDLAEVLLESGDEEQALRVGDEFARRFPLNDRPHLIMGEIRLRRFFRDLIPLDGLEALKHLDRAVHLAGEKERGRLLLGHLCFAVGAFDRMHRSLSPLLSSTPSVKEFLENLPPKAEDMEEGLPASEWIRAVEARGSLPYPPHRFLPSVLVGVGGETMGKRPPTEVAVEQIMVEIGSIPGVEAAAVLDEECRPLSRHGTGEISDMSAEIVRTAEEATRRMDVGSLEWCTIQGDFGCLTITRVHNVHVAARYGPPLRPENAPRALEVSAEKLYSPPVEVDGA